MVEAKSLAESGVRSKLKKLFTTETRNHREEKISLFSVVSSLCGKHLIFRLLKHNRTYHKIKIICLTILYG